MQQLSHPIKFKNNLRIIWGSKPKIFKNIEAQKKLGILIKKRVYVKALG